MQKFRDENYHIKRGTCQTDQKELIAENKKLLEKMKNIQNIDFYDKDLDNHPNFIHGSPDTTKSKSIINSVLENNSRKENIDEESSDFSDIVVESSKISKECASEDSDSDCSEKKI